MIIVVRWTEWLQGTKVERFVDLPNAKAYEESLPADQTVWIFDTDSPRWLEAAWETRYSTLKFAEIFRAFGGTVNKFENKDVALRRVGLKIVDLAQNSTLQTYTPAAKFVGVNSEGNDMAREVKIGEFKQVRANTDLGKVLTAAFTGDGTLAGVAEATGLNQDKVKSVLSSGRRSHGIDFVIGAETGNVTINLPDSVTQETVFATVKEKVAKESRQPKIGEFKQVRRTSALGKLVEAAQDGDSNIAYLAVLLGETEEQVTSGLKNLRRSYGIDHEIGEDGQVRLLVPEDQDPFIPVKEKVVREPSDGAKSAIPGGAVITLLVAENPKRPTAAAHARFALYRTGQTVAEFLAAGGTKADLSWDRVHGFIRIDGGAQEVQQAAE